MSQCAEDGYADCSTHPGNFMIKNFCVFLDLNLKLQPQGFWKPKKRGSAAEVGWASQKVNSCDG